MAKSVLIVVLTVHPTVLRDVTVAASDSEAHAVEHTEEVGELMRNAGF